jgi:hypothetical protein
MQTTRQIKVPSFTVQAGPPTYQPPPTPRRVSLGALAAVLILLLGIGCVVVAVRALTPPGGAATIGPEGRGRGASTPTPAVLAVEPVVAPAKYAGVAPVEPATAAPLAVITPAVETMHVSDQGVTQPAPAHQPRYSPRGGPLPGQEAQPAPQRVETYRCAWPRPVSVSIMPGVNRYRVEHHGDDMWLWWGAGTIGDPNYKQCRLQDVWEPFGETWEGRRTQ